MGVFIKGITEDDFKAISWESVYTALKRQNRIVEVAEPREGRLHSNMDRHPGCVMCDEHRQCVPMRWPCELLDCRVCEALRCAFETGEHVGRVVAEEEERRWSSH